MTQIRHLFIDFLHLYFNVFFGLKFYALPISYVFFFFYLVIFDNGSQILQFRQQK